MARDATLTEWVAATLATLAVGAIVYLSIDGDQSARTALTGLVGAAASYFLTPKLRNGNGKPTPPPAS
jgi:hypothetical protein